MEQASYTGRYFRTSWGDIKSSKGWFGKICLLGLISFIPVFGQMTVYGYAYEWAHKAAWGVEGPMPRKIYGRENSKMLRWGWFALVIAVVFALVPGIVSSIASWIGAMGAETGIYTATGRYMVVSNGNVPLMILGWIIGVAGIVLAVFACVLTWVGTMRMTMYDRLGAGFSLSKIWAMMKHDFGGIMRIFGMNILFGLVGGLIIGLVTVVVTVMILGVTVLPMLMVTGGGSYYSDSAIVGYVLTLIATLFPFLLVMSYVTFVFAAFLELLVARAMGYWMRQFDVARWGKQNDPLPFEVEGAQYAAPSEPAPPQDVPTQGDTPAPPTGSPVVEGCPVAPTTAAVAVEVTESASGATVVEAAEEVAEEPNPVLLEAQNLTVEPELPEGDGKADESEEK